jgi:tetratricopeptide (TPR) repeat protein
MKTSQIFKILLVYRLLFTLNWDKTNPFSCKKADLTTLRKNRFFGILFPIFVLLNTILYGNVPISDPQINKETFFGNNIIHCIDLQYTDTVGSKKDKKTYEIDIRRFVESGNTNLSIDNFSAALSDFRFALNFAVLSEDSSRIASIHNLIGLSFDRQYLYDEALRKYLIALEIADKCNAVIEKISSLNYIGGIYYKQTQYEKSLNYYVQSLSLSRTANYEKGIAAALNNVGEIYRLQGQLDNAQNHYLAALKINQTMNNREWASLNYENIGKIHFLKGQYSKALEFYMNSFENLPRESPLLSSIYISIGETYHVQNRNDAAVNFFQKAFSLAESKNDWVNMKTSAKHLSEIYSKAGNYKLAYELRDKQSLAQDTLNAIVANYRLIGLQTVLDLAARDKELEQKNKELLHLSERQSIIRKQRTWLISTIALLFLSAFAFISWLRYKIKTARQVAEKSEKLREAEQQLRTAVTSASNFEKLCINEQLKYRHNQLVLLAQTVASKNELLQDVSDSLRKVRDKNPNEINKAISDILLKIRHEMNSDKDTDLFQRMLDELNEEFFIALREKYSDLTHRELQLLAMIKLNLSSKEIASLQNIGTKAVEMAKYRLRKRLNIESNEEFKQLLC